MLLCQPTHTAKINANPGIVTLNTHTLLKDILGLLFCNSNRGSHLHKSTIVPMDKFKALFSRGKDKGKYKAVSRSSFDNDEPREALEEDDIASLRRTICHLIASLAIVTSALFFTLVYIVVNNSQDLGRNDESLQRIGSDPNGFVPPGKNCAGDIPP